MPVDAGTIEIAAVETGPQTRRRRGKGLGFAAWLSIAWIALVVGLAILAPVLPLDDPKESITEIARRGPLADAGSAPGHLLGGDFNGRDMLSRLHLGRAHDARRRHGLGDHRLRARRRSSGWSAATSGARSTSSSASCSTCSSPSPR